MFQDNTSTIKSLKNGRNSSGKWTRYFYTLLFYAKDFIDRKEVVVRYCPTEEILAD